ncbi:MAG: hypothetical protein H7A43_08690 [Verrucomicrobia bacterium]|nr:hypothetical protein [Verrucomicrobiota bacterium]
MNASRPPIMSREEQAHREVGFTEISPRAAKTYVLVWLALIALVWVVDHAVEWRTTGSLGQARSLAVARALPDLWMDACTDGTTPASWLTLNRSLLQVIDATETAVDDEGAVAAFLRPWAQAGLWAVGAGNEQVYRGRQGWMFYRAGLDSVTAPGFLNPAQWARRQAMSAEWDEPPQPDPLLALNRFHRDLQARKIELILVPVPVKPELLPDQFSARYRAGDVARNPSMPEFLARCSDAGITVADVAGWLKDEQTASGRPAYLYTDTHWTPEAMALVAERLADLVREKTGWAPVPLTPVERTVVTNRGDVAAMLTFPSGFHPFPEETVTVSRVVDREGGWWRADPGAEVLVLGDSFSNIYSLEGMGWGESGGWVEHLARNLGRPVDRLVRNDAGAYATRQLLARELARGRDRLAGKKVVVYQFATRELALGDWKVLPLELGEALPSEFLRLSPGEQVEVSGIVREVSRVPRPGAVPYRDHVVSVHLVDLQRADDEENLGEAVVFLQSMADNHWTAAARLRPGDQVALQLRSWEEMAETMEGINRSELDALDLQLEEPVWGELRR